MNILFEVSPIDPSGNQVTLWMSHRSATVAGIQLGDHEWKPLITKMPVTSMDLMDGEGNLTSSVTSRGSIGFILTEAFENEIWSNYVWNKAPARIWIGELGDAFEQYQQIFEGAVSSIGRDGITATVELIGPDAKLDVDLLSLTYKGTGGAEGPKEFEGNLKPWCSGHASNVDPVWFDQQNVVFQVHGYGPVQDIPKVYERAEALDFAKMKASVSTYAELIAVPLAPAEWAICLPLGMFRLGGAPRFKITADVRGAKFGSSTPDTIPTIIPHLLSKAGIPPEKIGDFSQFAGVTWDFYTKDQVSIGDVVRDAMAQVGGFLFADGEGRWHGSDFYFDKPTKPLTSNRSTAPLVRPGTIQQLTVADPIWKVEVGYDRCWSVHTKEEVSPALSEALDANTDTVNQLVTDIGALGERVDNVTGVDLYPVMSRVDELAAIGIRNLTANDRASQAFRDEAFQHVDELRADFLADGTSWAEAIDNLTTSVGHNASAIVNVETLLTNADQAITNQLGIVTSKTDTNAAAIVDEKNTTTTKFEAVATQLSELEAEVADANAGISAEHAAWVAADAAETAARTLQISNLNASLTAAITNATTTLTTKDTALSTQIGQVSTRAEDAHSRITNEALASAGRDSANAASIITVQSNLNGTNASLALVQQSITTTSNRLGVVEGKYVLSVQGGTDIAGMTVAAGGGTSKMVFQAGALAFRNPSTNGTENLMEFVGGQLRLRSAVIGDATIKRAHIQDLAVGTNNIALNAVTVTHFAERTAMLYGNNTTVESLRYVLTAPNDCDLIILLSSTQGFPSGDRLYENSILCNGTILRHGGGQKTNDTPTLFARIRVAAGTHTISANWRGGDGSVRLAAMNMIILEARR